MSDRFDYVMAKASEAADDRLKNMLAGRIADMQDLKFNNGYLKAVQDFEIFSQDFTESQKPKPQPDDEEYL